MKRGENMSKTFPGTTIEVLQLEKQSSKRLFDGIFATGGITLSQVSVMTGLEPYMIQNWVRRGFLTSPQKRMYSRQQFARIVIINMLKDSLQIEKICKLIEIIEGNPNDPDDDLVSDNVLYHMYVDMIAAGNINILDEDSVKSATANAAIDFEERQPGDKKKLSKVLEVMLYAHYASKIRIKAEQNLISFD